MSSSLMLDLREEGHFLRYVQERIVIPYYPTQHIWGLAMCQAQYAKICLVPDPTRFYYSMFVFLKI